MSAPARPSLPRELARLCAMWALAAIARALFVASERLEAAGDAVCRGVLRVAGDRRAEVLAVLEEGGVDVGDDGRGPAA